MDDPDRLGVGSLECGNIFCLLRGLFASAEDFWASSCFLVSYLAAFCLAFFAALLVCLATSALTEALSTLLVGESLVLFSGRDLVSSP